MARAPKTSRPKPPSGGRASRSFERPSTGQARAVSAEKRERKDAQQQLIQQLKAYERAAEAVQRGDNWQNAVTGLGIPGRDWTQSTTIESDPILTRQQTDDLYAQDNLAAKIVDTPAEDAIMSWFELVGVSGEAEVDFQRQIFSHFQRLQASPKMLDWLKFGRKDGGGVLLIGADDGRNLDEPLDIDNVREVRHLHHLERWLVWPDTIDIDPTSDHFGEPLYYTLIPRSLQSTGFSPARETEKTLRNVVGNHANMRIHHTRVIPYRGVKVSERRKLMLLGWGYSILQRPYWSIQNYRVLWAHIATLFKHMAQTVVKFAGYKDMSTGDFAKAIKARLATLQQARSTLSIVPIDAEDSFEEQTLRGLSGALEVLKYAQEDLAQASDMPLTKLFGHLPQGFGKEDASGRENWNRKVRGVQEAHLRAPLTNLIKMLVRAYRIDEPEGWEIAFLPIDAPTGTEAADIDFKEAQADSARIEDGVIAPEEARDSLRADPRCRYQLKAGAAKHDPVANPEFVAKQQKLINPPAPAAPAAGGAA